MTSNTIRFWLSGGRKRHVLELYDLIRPQTYDGLKKIRVGNDEQDGGYVMADDFDDIEAALSLGIGGDITWDTEMSSRGVEIYQFDHTVQEPAEVADDPKLHFHSIGIAAQCDPSVPMKSLDKVLDEEMGSHKGDLILKIDIDGYEWQVFEAIPDELLARFQQICIEIHNPLARPTQRSIRERNLNVLRKLHRVFAPVHLHANNAGPIRILAGLPVPKLLEITYVRRNGQNFSDSTESFPGELDTPNIPSRPEIQIGQFISLE